MSEHLMSALVHVVTGPTRSATLLGCITCQIDSLIFPRCLREQVLSPNIRMVSFYLFVIRKTLLRLLIVLHHNTHLTWPLQLVPFLKKRTHNGSNTWDTSFEFRGPHGPG